LYVLVEYFHIWYIFSQIIAIGIATLWNYGGSKTWVFHHQKVYEIVSSKMR